MEMRKDENPGLKSYGYHCPGMPLGLRLAWKAMGKRGVSKVKGRC
ncbi:MAG: hypothetical protein PWQ63_732 [Methanolobus sp.]|nr:hypothetical protein [Methanolobus sp.]